MAPGENGTGGLYIQHASPGAGRETNWLPAPEGAFNVIMHMHWPKKEVLQGKYQVPPVRPAK